MKCPQCNAQSQVLETRNLTWRRRKCFNGHQFNTEEVPIKTMATQTTPNINLVLFRVKLARVILHQKGYLK